MFLKNLTERVISVLGRDVFVAIINFFITTFIASKLGPELFGMWISVLTLLVICDLTFRLKIDQLIVFYSQIFPSNKALYSKISALNLYALIAGGIFIFIFHKLIIDFFSLGGSLFLALVYVSFSLSVFGNITFYIFLAESKYSTYNLSILLQSITMASLTFILFHFFGASVSLALLAQLLSWVTVLLFFVLDRLMFVSEKQSAVSTPINLSNKSILVKGSNIYFASALRALADQLPRLFAINFLGATFVGGLGLAQIIIGLVNRFPRAVNTVLYPMLVEDGSDELKKSMTIIRSLMIIFIPIILCLELFIPSLILMFYGVGFENASIYVSILLPFVYLGLPGLILSSYFASQGLFKILLIINLVALIGAALTMYLVSLVSLEYAPILGLCSVFLFLTTVSLYFAVQEIALKEIFPRPDDLRGIFRVAKSVFGVDRKA